MENLHINIYLLHFIAFIYHTILHSSVHRARQNFAITRTLDKKNRAHKHEPIQLVPYFNVNIIKYGADI